MRRLNWLRCLWPGLTRLGSRGEWLALSSALVFAGLLQVAVTVTFFGPATVNPRSVKVVWLVLATVWIAGLWSGYDDLAAATILSGATGALLRNMLSAIGIDLASCYRASLSVSRPASGRLPPQDFAPLADAMRHHIALAQPQNLLLLGTGPSEALLGQTIQHARDGLHEFNQKSGKMALIATYHPRTLLKRPQCKRPAWEDLQKLLKVGRW